MQEINWEKKYRRLAASSRNNKKLVDYYKNITPSYEAVLETMSYYEKIINEIPSEIHRQIMEKIDDKSL